MTAFGRLAALLFIVGVALGPAAAESPRDGRHDFDFSFGTWKTHISRLVHPLTAKSRRLEIAYSTDGGRSWETNWVMVDTKMDESAQ